MALTITDLCGNDQGWVCWGIESNAKYDFTASGQLFYEAEGRTPLGGATAVAGPTGASGTGSNVIRHSDLSMGYSGVMSTQAVSAVPVASPIGSCASATGERPPEGNLSPESCERS